MKRFVDWLFRLLHVPEEPPSTEGAKVLDARQPSSSYFRLQMITWSVVELGGLLFIAALLLTEDIPFLPNFGEEWLRFFLKPESWVDWFDETPRWLLQLQRLNPFGGMPNLVLYGYGFQALSSLLLILSKVQIRTSWFVVDETGIRTRTGLFTVQEKNADFSRIQSLTLKCSILQGLFGMGDIELHTASPSGPYDDKDKTTLAFRNIGDARQVYTLIQDQMLETLGKAEVFVPTENSVAPELVAARALLVETQNLRAGFQG